MTGSKCDPEWINRRRLLRAAERLTDEQRHKQFEKLHVRRTPTVTSPPPGSPKSCCEDVLACTARGGLRYEISAALYAFYTFCAACSDDFSITDVEVEGLLPLGQPPRRSCIECRQFDCVMS